MLDKIVYKFFAGLDIFCTKLDSVYYDGHKKIRSLFKRKRKAK